MDIKYHIDEQGILSDIEFTGYNGNEYVTSLKAALMLMRPTNPAILFAEHAKAGDYNDYSDPEYYRMLNSVKKVASIWQYPEDFGKKPGSLTQMNVLTLLENAIRLISEQASELYELKGEQPPK